MEALANPEIWIALATLTALELGPELRLHQVPGRAGGGGSKVVG